MNAGAVVLSKTGAAVVGDFSNLTGAPIVGDTSSGVLYWFANGVPFPINALNVLAWATGDGATIDTAAFVTALAATPVGGALRFPAATYLGVLSVRRNDITLIFEGCTIKHPPGAVSNVLELGDTASGNLATAYEKINIIGQVLLDGNKANVTAPTGDVTGWGFCATKISNSDWNGIRAKNCHNGGTGIFINSNYNKGAFYVESCGNATHTGPGFDINSSKYGIYDFISKDCYAGGRVLDNCYGLEVRGTVFNATKDGFIFNNQSVNSSYANSIDVTVYTCGQHGLNIGENCFNNTIVASTYNATNSGCVIGDGTAHPSYCNIISLETYNSGEAGLLIKSDGNDNTITHQTNLDGRTGVQGTSFAVDCSGNRNKLSVTLIDSATWQVRGIAFRSGAVENDLTAYSFTNTLDPYSDLGTRTKFNRGTQQGADQASVAGTLTLPLFGSIFNVTGANTITSIAVAGCQGRTVTLITTATAGLTDGSNLKLSANFAGTADDTITLCSDGTNWYEIARSAN